MDPEISRIGIQGYIFDQHITFFSTFNFFVFCLISTNTKVLFKICVAFISFKRKIRNFQRFSNYFFLQNIYKANLYTDPATQRIRIQYGSGSETLALMVPKRNIYLLVTEGIYLCVLLAASTSITPGQIFSGPPHSITLHKHDYSIVNIYLLHNQPYT